MKATRVRATIGEISYAMERVFGRFKLHKRKRCPVCTVQHFRKTKTGAGYYHAIAIESFVEKHGRRPRMLVCKMGQDGFTISAAPK